MTNFKVVLLTFIFILPLHASRAENFTTDLNFESEDGNLIAEPTLADYIDGNRVPGILVEPYDIVDAD